MIHNHYDAVVSLVLLIVASMSCFLPSHAASTSASTSRMDLCILWTSSAISASILCRLSTFLITVARWLLRFWTLNK